MLRFFNTQLSKNFLKNTLFTLLLFIFVFCCFQTAEAQDPYVDDLTEGTVVLQQGSLVRIILNIIRLNLGFLGAIAVLVIIYGGFTWMTAAGNEEKVKNAKSIIRNGIIGLVIVLLAFAIATFVINTFLKFAGGQPTGGAN